jgi:hypothetical protein
MASLVHPDDVSKAMQQAVDDGCLRADGVTNETHYDWTKPLLLVPFGPCPPPKADDDLTLTLIQPSDFPGIGVDMAMLSCFEDAAAIPNAATDLLASKSWWGELSKACYKANFGSGRTFATIKLISGTVSVTVSGTVSGYAVGTKLWSPKSLFVDHVRR